MNNIEYFKTKMGYLYYVTNLSDYDLQILAALERFVPIRNNQIHYRNY